MSILVCTYYYEEEICIKTRKKGKYKYIFSEEIGNNRMHISLSKKYLSEK